MGIVKAIYLRPERHAETVSVESAKAIVGTGLEGDHFKKKNGCRQITIMAQADWDAVCKDLGEDLDPMTRRANLLINNTILKNTTGKILQIGEVEIQIEGETTPCRIMDEAHDGLKAALTTEWRGGVYGKIITTGIIRIGNKVSFK